MLGDFLTSIELWVGLGLVLAIVVVLGGRQGKKKTSVRLQRITRRHPTARIPVNEANQSLRPPRPQPEHTAWAASRRHPYHRKVEKPFGSGRASSHAAKVFRHQPRHYARRFFYRCLHPRQTAADRPAPRYFMRPRFAT